MRQRLPTLRVYKASSGVEVYGIDISSYAIENAKEEIKDSIQIGNANSLPFDKHLTSFSPLPRCTVCTITISTKRFAKWSGLVRKTNIFA